MLDPNTIVVYKNRTNILPVSFGFDVSGDTFASDIRVDPKPDADLIASWGISFATDGVDGELYLTLDDETCSAITNTRGFMDMKRTSDGVPLPVFAEPLEVSFQDAVTP
jgi:hypothetical protein